MGTTPVDIQLHENSPKSTRVKQHHLQYAQTIHNEQTVSMQPEVQTVPFDTQMMQDAKIKPMLDYSQKRKNRKLYVKGKALKNIPPHTKLFDDYGKEYWRQYAFPHSHKTKEKTKYYITKK